MSTTVEATIGEFLATEYLDRVSIIKGFINLAPEAVANMRQVSPVADEIFRSAEELIQWLDAYEAAHKKENNND